MSTRTLDENDASMENISDSLGGNVRDGTADFVHNHVEDDSAAGKLGKDSFDDENYAPETYDYPERKQFFFQQRRGKLDLRAISKVDLDQLVRDTDIDVLQAFLENVTFSNLREEDLRYLTDPLVIKLFRISQMTIEYLLYSQEQLANDLQSLTSKYTAKKRNLAKKRKELLELQEANKHLKGEVKSKKKGITTLEALLKDASRTKGTENRARIRATEVAKDGSMNAATLSTAIGGASSSGVGEAGSGSAAPSSAPNSETLIRFFVTFSDGLCLEFTKKAGYKIWELRADIKRAYLSRRPESGGEAEGGLPDWDIRLRGITLLDEANLLESRLESGDTLTVHITERPKEVVDEVAREKETLLEVMIERQQESQAAMLDEIRKGLDQAMESIASTKEQPVAPVTSETDVRYDIDSKLSQFEDRVRQQLEFQMEMYQQKLREVASAQASAQQQQQPSNRYMIQPGELEDDEEAQSGRSKQNEEHIKALERRLSSKEVVANTLKETVAKQEEELAALKAQLAEKKEDSTGVVPVVAEGKSPAPAKPAARKETKSAKKEQGEGKKGTRPQTEEPEPQKRQQPPPVVAPPEEPYIDAAKSSELSEPVETVLEIHPAAEPVSESEPEPEPDWYVVTFTSEHSLDLEDYDKSFVQVEISSADSTDDIVFNLRRVIAEILEMRMTRVYLQLEGRKIVNGVDIERPLMAVEVKELVDNGLLVFCLQKNNPITESQVDFLVDEWNSKLEGEGEEMMEKEKAAMRDSREFKSSKESMIKNAHSMLSDVKTDSDVIELRTSLDSMFNSIHDKAGLTDEELQMHLENINSRSQSLNPEWSNHMKKVRTMVAGTLGVTINSDHESNEEESGGGRKAQKEPTLKLLRASNDAPLMRSLDASAEGKRKERYAFSGSLDSDSGADMVKGIGHSGGAGAKGLGATTSSVSDFDFDESTDLDITTRTVESDFTLTKKEGDAAISGGGAKRVSDSDSSVQRRADEIEKEVSRGSKSPGSWGETLTQQQQQQRTPVTRPKGTDSNYSKSSSMSNLSPFGTLEEVQDFDHDDEDGGADNPADGSLALSASDASMAEISFASL